MYNRAKTNIPMRKRNKNPSVRLRLRSCREDMQNDLIEHVRFNRFDMKFMTNINNKYIANGRPLSLNQNDVYEKIIHRYKKQLKNLGVPARDILSLPWERGLASPEDIQRKTYFRLIETGSLQMEMYFPYNESLKKEVQALVGDDAGEYLNVDSDESWSTANNSFDFRWYPDEKRYRGTFDPFLFRKLYDFSVRNNIIIDSYIQRNVDRLNSYGTDEDWTPSIKIVDGKLYISGLTQSMVDYIDENDIDLSDTSEKNIERVCRLGLTPPREVSDIAEFISPNAVRGISVATQKDLDRVYEYLKRTGRKALWIKSGRVATHTASPLVKELQDQAVNIFENLNWDSPILQIEKGGYNDSQVRETQSKIDFAKEKGYNTIILTSRLNDVLRSQSFLGKVVMDADKVLYLKG